ncbi:DNA polymerase Y subunit UmuC family protein [Catalinimonas niigatensis]|uniref:hypothetical protein n=1 Tax=Catalinimonas niigatensis TaxID=1397264 RepID=UPI00266636B0|nr:hypothetical protein [Catalinimonas niigatensis]WPP48929.1 hypothetical protein PZB72_19880 [Catalinimonas niigatensis]
MANKLAKKGSGIHVLEKDKDITEVLKNTEIGDLWGIGGKYAQKLKKMGIKTAYELIQLPENWFRKEIDCSRPETLPGPKRLQLFTTGTGHQTQKEDQLYPILSHSHI